MKQLIIITILVISFSCGKDKVRLPLPNDFKTAELTWEDYNKYCGSHNIMNTQNFNKLINTPIVWKGKVVAIEDDVQSGLYSAKTVSIKMPKSDSIISDIQLRMPLGSEKEIVKGKVGDFILFQGQISYIGTSLSPHIVLVSKFKFETPKFK